MALIDNAEWVAWQENGTETGRVTNDGAYDIAAARQSVDGLRQLIEQLEADIAGGAVGVRGRYITAPPLSPGRTAYPPVWRM